nr:hypothetical protein [Sphingomonas bacterium]
MNQIGRAGGNAGIDKAVLRAARLPLAGISAAMLATATAFFCYAMPQRVLGSLLGAVGIAGPVGGFGRTVFLLLCAVLAGLSGLLAVTIAGRAGRTPKVQREPDMAVPSSRRRNAGPAYPPGTIEGAPPPLAARRSDLHPDAPPRRPIFADHDLPGPDSAQPAGRVGGADGDVGTLPASPAVPQGTGAEPPAAATTAQEIVPVPAPAQEAAAPEPAAAPPVAEPTAAEPPAAEPATPESATAEPATPEPAAPEPSAAEPAPEPPGASSEPLSSPPPVPGAGPQERTIASLMARFERGLDRCGNDLPPAPSAEQIAALHDPQPSPEDTLRSAIEALQRISGRPR